jgi:hypothetical protein
MCHYYRILTIVITITTAIVKKAMALASQPFFRSWQSTQPGYSSVSAASAVGSGGRSNVHALADAAAGGQVSKSH